jgi:hypothetical protein
MRITLITMLIFISIISKAQTSSTVQNFDDCKSGAFFVIADTKPEFIYGTTGIAGYLNNYLAQDNPMQNLNGKVILGILVYEDGSCCCMNFSDFSNRNIKSDIFREAVKSMPMWNPATQRGRSVAFLSQIQLLFDYGKVIEVK